MLMVIFGAGASHDSCPTYPPNSQVPTGDSLNSFHRPPLAKDLFADRPLFAEAIERFPECQPIVPRLRSQRGETLEAALQDLQAKAEVYPRGVRQLAAVRYYLQYVIRQTEAKWRGVARGITNYKSLLDDIERAHKGNKPVCFVTFNYDTLFEDALSDFGLSIGNFSDYTQKHPFYKFFKLHGSVNWAREVETQLQQPQPGNAWTISRQLIERAAEIHIGETYTLCTELPVGLVNGKPCFPALAIPVEQKRNFECPQHMLKELTELLPRIAKILIVGWRATEAHFLELLREHLQGRVRLHTVAGSEMEALNINRALDTALPNIVIDGSTDHSGTGFTEFVLNRRSETFLSA